MRPGIYALVNQRNGKRYVGSAKNLQTRKDRHFSLLRRGKHSNLHLQRSYNRGDVFTFQVLEYCKLSNLVEREQYYIDSFKTLDNRFGYNLTIAGRTIPSKSGRRRISKFRKGKSWEQLYGATKANAAKESLSKRMAGEGNPRFGKGGKAHPFYGKSMKEIVGQEVADKMAKATSTAHKGKRLSTATKRKLSEAHTGKSLSDSHKRAIGKGLNQTYLRTGPRTLEQIHGVERAAEISRKIAESVSKATKGSKKSASWKIQLEKRRCKITGRILPNPKG